MVSIHKHLVRAAAVGAVGAAAMAGFVAPASAAQVAAPHMTAGVAVAAVPNTNIQGSPAKWSPTKLTAASHKGSKCTSKLVSFTITNKTKKSQTIQQKSSTGGKVPVGTLKAGQKGGICILNAKAGAKGDLYIKGSASVLTITIS
jgi:hypothetical protein